MEYVGKIVWLTEGLCVGVAIGLFEGRCDGSLERDQVGFQEGLTDEGFCVGA